VRKENIQGSSEKKEGGLGYHWPVFIAVIVASALNWALGYLIFSRVTLSGLDWLDIVLTYVWSLWWIFAFATWGFWPFTKIKGWWTKGIVMLIASWILGVLSTYITGIFVDLKTYGFPVIANLFFWIVVTDFSFSLWPGLPPQRKALLDLIFWHVATILTIFALPSPGQIPAWWFVPTQWLLGSGIFALWTKDMKKGEAGITFWLINAFMVLLAVFAAQLFGHYRFSLANSYTSILTGYSPYFLIWFGAGCSFNWCLWVIFEGWPWRKIKPPTLGAILGFVAYTIVQIIAGLICIEVMRLIIPPTSPADVRYLLHAFALVYAGVYWGFAIPMAFPSRRTGFPPTWKWE